VAVGFEVEEPYKERWSSGLNTEKNISGWLNEWWGLCFYYSGGGSGRNFC
jgi:plasmid maintenance system killer protein